MTPNTTSAASQSFLRPTSRDDFHVAVLCALSLEADAVRASMDRVWTTHDFAEYEELQKLDGDTNSYTCGTIGRHNVVLVHLPKMGTVEASSVAAMLCMSYPNITLGAVVGICGVVPGMDSLRRERILGDVIISTSIVTYDSGRETDEGFEQRTGVDNTLSGLPTELMGFIKKQMGVKAREELEEQTRLNLVAIRKAKSDAQYPGKAADRIFEPECLHGDRDIDCDELECGARGEIYGRARLGKDDDDPSPFVHYGVVASANCVMRAAKRRDKIAKEDSAIAFEMEGAGAWNKFPCLVIKGACDYSDGHKHKKFQNYAAATAASCFKGLLSEWMPSGSGSQHRRMQMQLKADLNAVKTYLSPQDDGKEHIHRFDAYWLVQQDAFKKWNAIRREPSKVVPAMLTVKGKMFSGKSVLFKEALKQKMTEGHCLVLYHFFRSGIVQGRCLTVFLRHILGQLLDGIPDITAEEVKAWRNEMDFDKKGSLWSNERLEATIQNLILRGKDVFERHGKNIALLIDGVNDCSDSVPGKSSDEDKGPLLALKFIHRLLKFTEANQIDLRVCISRRPTPDYGKDEPPIETTVVTLDEYANKEVQLFVENRLKELDDPLKEMRVLQLLRVQWCDDFHWATLKTEAVIQATFSLEEEQDIISIVHGDYESMYGDTLKSLGKSKKSSDRAMKLLHLCLGSYRAMTVDEFRQALAYSAETSFATLESWSRSNEGLPDGTEFERFVRTRTKNLLDISAHGTPPVRAPSLRRINTEHLRGHRRVVFSHQSVEAYMRGERGIQELYPGKTFAEASAAMHQECHRLMLQICLNVLDRCNMIEEYDLLKGIEIRDYACEFWLRHAKHCGELSDDNLSLPRFLKTSCQKTKMQEIIKHQYEFLGRSRAEEHSILMQEEMESDDDESDSKPKPNRILMTLLASMGCTYLLREHVDACRACKAAFTPRQDNADASETGSDNSVYASSLRIAMELGHTDTVLYMLKMLPLRDINMLVNDRTLLYHASYFATEGKGAQGAERLKCVDLLLQRGADPTKESPFMYRYPLNIALKVHHIPLLKMLLRNKQHKKAMFRAKIPGTGYTALHFAVATYCPKNHGTLTCVLDRAPTGQGLLAIKDKKGLTPVDLVSCDTYTTDAEKQTIWDQLETLNDEASEDEHEQAYTVSKAKEDDNGSGPNKRRHSLNVAEVEPRSDSHKQWMLAQR